MLQPALGKLGDGHLRATRVDPSAAPNVGLDARQPGKSVGLSRQGCRGPAALAGVVIAGLAPARWQLAEAAEVVTCGSGHVRKPIPT